MKQIIRWLIATIGLVCLVAGAWGVLAHKAGSGGIALVIIGAVFILISVLIDRLDRISLSHTGLELSLSQQIADQGAPKAAHILDHTELARLAEAYAVIHDELLDPNYVNARIHLQDLLVARAAALARREKFEASEVNTLVRNGAPITRVLALGLMGGDPDLVKAATLASAISRSATRNEQYQALKLATRYWKRFTAAEQAMIHASIDHADMSSTSHRYEIAAKLRSLPVQQGNPGKPAKDDAAQARRGGPPVG
jgi:hypothetical protein